MQETTVTSESSRALPPRLEPMPLKAAESVFFLSRPVMDQSCLRTGNRTTPRRTDDQNCLTTECLKTILIRNYHNKWPSDISDQIPFDNFVHDTFLRTLAYAKREEIRTTAQAFLLNAAHFTFLDYHKIFRRELKRRRGLEEYRLASQRVPTVELSKDQLLAILAQKREFLDSLKPQVARWRPMMRKLFGIYANNLGNIDVEILKVEFPDDDEPTLKARIRQFNAGLKELKRP